MAARIDSFALLGMHVEALFVHDDAGRLRCVRDVGWPDAPRFYLGRSASGNLWRFRYDLPSALVAELEELCRDEPVVDELARPPRHDARYRALLDVAGAASSGPAMHVTETHGPTRAELLEPTEGERLRPTMADWAGDVAEYQPFAAVFVDGHARAVCASVRVTARAHEAGVETVGAWRGRGLAGETVRKWARAVERCGAIALYSTEWGNAASRRVATKLGMVVYGSDYSVG